MDRVTALADKIKTEIKETHDRTRSRIEIEDRVEARVCDPREEFCLGSLDCDMFNQAIEVIREEEEMKTCPDCGFSARWSGFCDLHAAKHLMGVGR